MDYILHISKTEWGHYFQFMAKDGHAFGRAYCFDDQPKIIYLDTLSINASQRKQGLGTEMQVIREQFGIGRGCKYSVLFVMKRSWMRQWYARRGYKWYAKYNKDNRQCWLRKKLA